MSNCPGCGDNTKITLSYKGKSVTTSGWELTKLAKDVESGRRYFAVLKCPKCRKKKPHWIEPHADYLCPACNTVMEERDD